VLGAAVHGPLAGQRLDSWPLLHTTVAAEVARDPSLSVHRVPLRSPVSLLFRTLHSKSIAVKGRIPFFFRRTMGEPDARLPELENGLGVIVDGRARYYRMASLSEPVVEDWGGRSMSIALGPLDGAPHAVWVDDKTRPMQLFTRWYGFSYTFPGAEIYGAD
jgi:hypothetical protein